MAGFRLSAFSPSLHEWGEVWLGNVNQNSPEAITLLLKAAAWAIQLRVPADDLEWALDDVPS